jgi:hypothetical protein
MQTGFFAHLADQGLGVRFARFYSAAGQGPQAAAGVMAALYHQ